MGNYLAPNRIWSIFDRNDPVKRIEKNRSPSLSMGNGCSSKGASPAEVENTTVVPYSPHTPDSVNKITPMNVPSADALMRLFNDYDLDG